MTRKTLTLGILALVLSAGGAAAQTIHGDPQKAFYESPAEYPQDPDLQCHWRAPNIGYMPGMPAHTHARLKCPDYAEIPAGPFTCGLTITLFNTTGQINAGNITFTANGTLAMDTPFPLMGGPGVNVYTGTVTFNLANSGLKVHGWQPIQARVVTNYTNRDILINRGMRPVYSVVDLTAPESPPGDGTGIRSTSSCQIIDASDPDNLGNARWQQNQMEFLQILPTLGPVTPGLPWQMVPIAYNYGGTTGLPPGTFELRLDPDFHNNIPGTVLLSSTHGDSAAPALDKFSVPDNVPDGPHKLTWMWRRPNMAGDKELDALLVFNVTVGPGGVAQPPNTSQVPVLPGAPGCRAGDSASTTASGKLYQVKTTDQCVFSVTGPHKGGVPPCTAGATGTGTLDGIKFMVTVDSACVAGVGKLP
jgi:hypothetical protein